MTGPEEYSEEHVLEYTTTLEKTPTFVSLAHVQSAGSVTRNTSRRRSSALEAPQIELRARSSSIQLVNRDDFDNELVLSLTRTASRIAGHDETYRDTHRGRHSLPTKPEAAKKGGFDVIKEVPTPFPSRPPSPLRFDRAEYTISRPPSRSSTSSDLESAEAVDDTADAYPTIGTINSPRGFAILICVCTAQLIDNIFMTGVNISLPAIQNEFEVPSSELQWLISAYTLTFGGFLLVSGVLADRYGRKHIFCGGMVVLSIWTLANGFASSFIQMAIFRALQGIAAAATVPSSVGIISSYFVAKDRSRALSLFAASGAVGFCLGLVLGGFLTASLGWRYLFYFTVIVTSAVSIIGCFILPKDRLEGLEKPKLDFAGVALSTSGLILLSFVLSSGGEYGWSKAFIIVLLIASILMLVSFTWIEKKVSNPIMPLSLWKLKNFAGLWIAGFVMYGGYQTIIYYTVLIVQDVQHLSAGETAIRYLPMGACGFIVSASMGALVDRVNIKSLLLFGMLLCTLAPLSAVMMTPEDTSFWKHIFPTTLLGVAGVSICYCTISVVLLNSVPVNVKSLCAGMINTAYQIGSGVALALSTAIIQAVDVKKGHSQLTQYETGLWCSLGLGALGLVASTVGVRSVGKVARSLEISSH